MPPLTLLGLIRLLSLAETIFSLLFLLHLPKGTFLASLSLGSPARQPPESLALAMSPFNPRRLRNNLQNGGDGRENGLKPAGCDRSGQALSGLCSLVLHRVSGCMSEGPWEGPCWEGRGTGVPLEDPGPVFFLLDQPRGTLGYADPGLEGG